MLFGHFTYTPKCKIDSVWPFAQKKLFETGSQSSGINTETNPTMSNPLAASVDMSDAQDQPETQPADTKPEGKAPEPHGNVCANVDKESMNAHLAKKLQAGPKNEEE